MFTQFFGQFLLNNELITSEELKNVFKNMKNTRLKLGMIAINEGFLNVKQVNKINNLQKTNDKRFGDIAIEKKYLNNLQLEIILNKQQSEHLVLAQTIVNLGYMSMNEFAEALNVYKLHYGLSDDSFEKLKCGKIDNVIYNMLEIDDQAIKEYVTLFYKNIVRFITSEVHISKSFKLTEKDQYNFVFEQEIFGDKQIYTAYTGEKNVLIPFSEIYAGEKIENFDEFSIDVCKEFLNLNNGLFAVNMSNKGILLNLKIQNFKENYVANGKELYCIPFHTNLGDINLIIGF
jgi:hypothetical protein